MRFPLCFGPILIHLRYVLPGGAAALFLCGCGVHVAVPMFFLFSGYLLYSGHQWTRAWFARKVRSRLVTLGVPFLLWNGVAVLASMALAALSSGGGGGRTSLNGGDLLRRLTGIGQRGNLPQNTPLWYVRDLLIHVFLTPVYALLARWFRWVALLGFGALFALAHVGIHVLPASVFTWFALEGMLFFYAGFLLVGRERGADRLADAVGWPALAVWLGASAVKAFWNPLGLASVYRDPLNCLIIPAGMLAVWFLAGKASRSRRVGSWLRYCAQFSFFLYATHILAVKACVSLLALLGPLSAARQTALGAGCLILITGGGIGLYLAMKRFCPRLLSLCTGTRSVSESAGPATRGDT